MAGNAAVLFTVNVNGHATMASLARAGQKVLVTMTPQEHALLCSRKCRKCKEYDGQK
jgi:hypothetical protein